MMGEPVKQCGLIVRWPGREVAPAGLDMLCGIGGGAEGGRVLISGILLNTGRSCYGKP